MSEVQQNVEPIGNPVWIDETTKFASSVPAFFAKVKGRVNPEDPNDDAFSKNQYDGDIYYSAGNAILDYSVEIPVKVQALTQTGKIQQIHIKYDSGADIYLYRKALEDFLTESK